MLVDEKVADVEVDILISDRLILDASPFLRPFRSLVTLRTFHFS